ncbi:hypothetical protein TNCV_2307721 [Trichonephila clavipes]|nr:hypothetical protein TNCV_2307721 [Trichonephila clavipes]
MDHDENLERCKLILTGMDDDALRIAGELFPKQTLKKYIRKEVEIDTDGRVRSRRFEKKRKVAESSFEATISYISLEVHWKFKIFQLFEIAKNTTFLHVYEWFARISEGRERVSDNSRSERSVTSVSNENTEKVSKLITKDRRLNRRITAG